MVRFQERVSGYALACATLSGCQFGTAGQGGAVTIGGATDPGASETGSTGIVDEGDDAGKVEGDAGSGDADSADADSADPDTTTATATTQATSGPSSTDDGDATGPEILPENCAQILAEDPGAQSGVFVIDPPADPPGGSGEGVEVHCDMDTDGGGWTRFWWWTPGAWPNAVTDVLESSFGTCAAEAAYCFSRLPPLDEGTTSLLAIDPQGPTKYRWDFDPANTTAHAAWLAFAEHMTIADGVARDGDAWPPIPLEGSAPPQATQDSFMYRTEHGVASILMDDDNCDCATTLQMGHGMCYGGWGTGSSSENWYGVDHLYNAGAESGPRSDFHLELYYR